MVHLRPARHGLGMLALTVPTHSSFGCKNSGDLKELTVCVLSQNWVCCAGRAEVEVPTHEHDQLNARSLSQSKSARGALTAATATASLREILSCPRWTSQLAFRTPAGALKPNFLSILPSRTLLASRHKVRPCEVTSMLGVPKSVTTYRVICNTFMALHATRIEARLASIKQSRLTRLQRVLWPYTCYLRKCS